MYLIITRIFPALFILLWSSGSIFVNLGLKSSDPFSFLFFRALLTSLILFIIFKLKNTYYNKIPIKKLMSISFVAFLLQFCYQLSFFLSLSHQISPSLMIIILSGQPILTAILIQNKLNFMQVLGLILGLFGLIFVIYQNLYAKHINYMGIIYSLIALFSITIGTISQKKFCRGIPLTTNLFIQYIFSSIIFAIAYLLFPYKFTYWNMEFITSLFWMVLIVSIAATYFLYFLIDKSSLIQVSNYFYCIPPMTAVLDYLTFHNSLSAMIILGMGLILTGQFLVKKGVSRGILKET